MIRVHADKQRMIFSENRAKLRCNDWCQKNGNTRANAQELNVRNVSQLPQQLFDLVVAEQQRVAAAEQHVTYCRCAADIINLLIEVRVKIVSTRIADQSRAGTIPAIRRATVGHKEQYPIRITMHQTRHGRMRVFPARVTHLPRRRVRFLHARNYLPADGTILIRWIYKVEEIRRNPQRELAIGELGARKFLRCQRRHQPLKLTLTPEEFAGAK